MAAMQLPHHLPRAIYAPPYMQGLKGQPMAPPQLNTSLLNLPGGFVDADNGGAPTGAAFNNDRSYEEFYKKYGSQPAAANDPQGKATQAYYQNYGNPQAMNLGAKSNSMGSGMNVFSADPAAAAGGMNNLAQAGLESFYNPHGANLLNSRSLNGTPVPSSNSAGALGSLAGNAAGNPAASAAQMQFGNPGSRSSTPGLGQGAANGAMNGAGPHQGQSAAAA